MGALNASSTLYFTCLYMELQGPAGRGRGKIGVYILTEIRYTIYAIQRLRPEARHPPACGRGIDKGEMV